MGRPRTNQKRDLAILDLVTEAHWKQSAVARVFHISRQRVHQILHGMKHESARTTKQQVSSPEG